MAYDDWNPDDFLDFDYNQKGPDNQQENKDYRSEYNEYLNVRNQKRQAASDDAAYITGKGKSTKVKRERQKKKSKVSDADRAALRKAQQEAQDRYLSNYDKNYKRKYGRKRTATASIWLTRLYLIALAVFAVSMAVMNVLPLLWLIVIFVLLILISAVVLPRMRHGGKKKSTRALATLASLILIFIYVMGTAYSLGTLSFLSSTSVGNENHVGNITRDPFNVVITGMDVDGTIDEEGRSDVNMVLTVNPKTAQLLMTSIPRDYQIYMPDKNNTEIVMDKLTHSGFYGVDHTIAAEEDLLGITANYYIKVNFTTVEKFIDAVGGVDVYSEYEFEPVKYKGWTVQEGMNHMDGEQALAFARERKAFPSGDNQRIKNQQAVFEALFKKATSSKTMLLNYNSVLSGLKDYVEMSFSSREVRKLVKYQISKNLKWGVFKNTLVGGDDSLALYSTGGEYSYVMTQDETSISHAKELINAVLEGEPLTKDENGAAQLVNSSDDESSGYDEDGE